MLRKFTITSRIVFLLVVMLIFLFGMLASFYYGIYNVKQLSVEKVHLMLENKQKEKIRLSTHSLAMAISSVLNDEMSRNVQFHVMREMIKGIHYENDHSGYFFILDSTTIVAHGADAALIGKNMGTTRDKNGTYFVREMMEKANSGGGFTTYIFEKPGKGSQPKLSYSEKIPGTDYIIGTGVYLDKIEDEKGNLSESIHLLAMQMIFILGGIILLIMIVLILPLLLVIRKSFIGPLRQLLETTLQIGQGNIEIEPERGESDEIGKVNEALHQLTVGLKTKAVFLEHIEKDDLTYDYKPISSEDKLGHLLLHLRDNLKEVREQEQKLRKEEQQRNWTTAGIAKFGSILRSNTDNLNELGYNIIKNLIDYLNASQGGVYLYNDDDAEDLHLQLIASYAYDRRKYLDKKIALGESLIGTAAVERNVIYLNQLPADYIKITSGLGYTVPRSLLIVPMVMDENLLGVVEIAAVNTFEPYQIEFVKLIAENAASVLTTVKMNKQTSDLLKQSQEQADFMREQEDLMRETIREMEGAQEDAKRREEQLRTEMQKVSEMRNELAQKDQQQSEEIERLKTENQQQIEIIARKEKRSRTILEKSLDSVIIITTDGTIEFFNQAAEKLWGYTAEEVLGEKVEMLMPNDYGRKHQKHIENYMATQVAKIIGVGREMPIHRKDGTTTDVFINIIESKVDNQVKFTAFIKDLTEQRQREQERSDLIQELMVTEFQQKTIITQLKEQLEQNNIQTEQTDFQKNILLHWDAEKHELGHKTIDKHHRHLVELMNKFYVWFLEKRPHAELQTVLDNILEYTSYHFSFEEDLMQKCDFKELEKHKKQHEKLAALVMEFQWEFNERRIETAYGIMKFFRNWLFDHIETFDRKFTDCPHFFDNDENNEDTE